MNHLFPGRWLSTWRFRLAENRSHAFDFNR